MEQILQSLPFLIAGLIAITLIDTLVARASRIFNFKYAFAAILSIAVYTFIGAYVSKTCNLSIAVAINLVLAFYDATVGWKLSQRMRANTGLSEGQLKKISMSSNLKTMLVVAIAFTFLGYIMM